MLDLSPTIAGVRLPFCLMNASGALSTTREELLALARSDSGAVVTKSITPQSFLDPGASCGLENPGHAYYTALVPELRRAGKPVIASVAGLTIEEFITVGCALAAAGADLIEINLNDPHIHNHLAPFASAQQLAGIVTRFRQSIPAPLAVKLPPTVPLPLSEVAAVLVDAAIPAAVCHNAAKDGALTQAQTMLQATREKLAVIAVGGVSSGAEAIAALQRGSKAVQIATAVVKEGPAAFSRIKCEMAQSLELVPAAL